MRRTLHQALVAAGAETRKRRGYGWCRLDNDFPDKPIWRLVAKRSGAALTQVVAVVLRLECLANRSDPRGSIGEMIVDEFAAALQLRPNVVARIRAALEEPDISWVDQDFIVDFHQRNPDHDDPTAAERQRRHRAKLKAARVGSTGPPLVHSHVTSRRDTVTVTADQITSILDAGENALAAAAAVEAPQGLIDKNSGDSGGDLASPVLWLALEGKRIVTERLKVPPTLAETKIERWRRELNDEPGYLVEIIRQAHAMAETDQRFVTLVTDQVSRHIAGTRGPQLPLLPPRPAKKAHHG